MERDINQERSDRLQQILSLDVTRQLALPGHQSLYYYYRSLITEVLLDGGKTNDEIPGLQSWNDLTGFMSRDEREEHDPELLFHLACWRIGRKARQFMAGYTHWDEEKNRWGNTLSIFDEAPPTEIVLTENGERRDALTKKKGEYQQDAKGSWGRLQKLLHQPQAYQADREHWQNTGELLLLWSEKNTRAILIEQLLGGTLQLKDAIAKLEAADYPSIMLPALHESLFLIQKYNNGTREIKFWNASKSGTSNPLTSTTAEGASLESLGYQPGKRIIVAETPIDGTPRPPRSPQSSFSLLGVVDNPIPLTPSAPLQPKPPALPPQASVAGVPVVAEEERGYPLRSEIVDLKLDEGARQRIESFLAAQQAALQKCLCIGKPNASFAHPFIARAERLSGDFLERRVLHEDDIDLPTELWQEKMSDQELLKCLLSWFYRALAYKDLKALHQYQDYEPNPRIILNSPVIPFQSKRTETQLLKRQDNTATHKGSINDTLTQQARELRRKLKTTPEADSHKAFDDIMQVMIGITDAIYNFVRGQISNALAYAKVESGGTRLIDTAFVASEIQKRKDWGPVLISELHAACVQYLSPDRRKSSRKDRKDYS